MRIKMTTDIQGYVCRSDGSMFEYPPRGQEIDVDDQTGRDLVHQGNAVPVIRRSVETTRPSMVEEEQRNVSAATVFTRPGSEPAPATDWVEEAITAIEEVAAVEMASPAAEEPPVRRPRGRPRKNPYLGQ